ncbi:MAG: LacI family DNA-binding transcriptional regulator [Anaerolineales bacterium]|nr:LacI family DNA-binding transcriptional regulator [Anaerolineales bacterium]
MPTKIEDVARRAGVSTATVSRVLSGKPYVSDELRQRVLGAVNTLNYRPSRVARSLRVQRSSIIGLIVSDIQNPFFTAVVRAIEDTAYQNKFSVFLCNSDEDVGKETMYLDLMLAEHVAGVIISPTAGMNDAYRRLVEERVPAVAIDRRITNVAIDSVLVDNVGAARQLVTHLIEQGHSRIGAVLGTPASSTGEERLRGYLDALHAHGLPVEQDLIRTGMPRILEGHAMMRELLQLPKPPTAVFTGNALLTIGALRAIHSSGLRFPDDIAMAAFDEMDWMFFVKPALTVVAQPTYDLGRLAVELLLKRMDEPDRPIEEVVLAAHVHYRESSKWRVPNANGANHQKEG